MSLPSQPNGKKSSNSSIANTPASTPVTVNGNAQGLIHNSPPPNNNAPKYGTLVPNRIFVGGISANTTEGELLQLFSTYGTVKAAKIIQDRAGVSKGYGFITFESEDDAQRPLREADNIVLRERKLNIAPAVKKQPFNFNRAFDGSSPTTVAVGNPQYFLPPSMPYFQGSVGYYAPPSAPVPGDPSAQQPVYQPPPVYPGQTGPPQPASYPSVMFPTQTIYMPQQYPMPMPYEYGFFTNNGAPTQYMVGAQGGPGPQGPPLPPSGSPPRPPCYNQQVSYSSEPVYYNMSVYGAMDHPPVYTEPIEGCSNYTEEPYMGQCLPHDLDARFNNARSTPCDSSTQVPDHQQHHNLIAPSSHVPPSTTPARYTTYATTTTVAEQLMSQQRQQQQPTPPTQEPETARQSTTPVVSLLSIDHTVEKDFNAMQGGRKKKPLAAPTPSMNQTTAVFAAPVVNGVPQGMFPSLNCPPPSLNFQHAQSPFPAPFQPFMHGPHHQQQLPFNGHGPQFQNQRPVVQTNGYARRPNNNNTNNGRRFYGNGRNHNENSNRSSLRTDSSSSATSGVEEIRNHDESRHRTCVNTPPPAPYSPLTNHGYTMRYNGVVSPNGQFNGSRPNRNYQNGHNASQYDNRRTSGRARTNNYNGRTSNNSRSDPTEVPNGHQHRSEVNLVNNTYDSNAPTQVQHSGGSTSFAPARRNRRSIRRSNAGAGLSEIGAGDAPLPQNSDSVSEACKKLDNLKL